MSAFTRIYILIYGILLVVVPLHTTTAQDTTIVLQRPPLEVLLPTTTDWNFLEEGKPVVFQLLTKEVAGRSVQFSIRSGQIEGMYLDSTGLFRWTPSYALADRITTLRIFPVVFEALASDGERATVQANFRVVHVNRPPQIDELRPFYVQYKTPNSYTIDATAVSDPDGDPVVFVLSQEGAPEGLRMNATGEISWEPSLTQFNILKRGPRYVEFYVEDQPAKARTKGRVRLEITQMDLAPELTMVPNVQRIGSKENTPINLKFFLSDPNGEDDIMLFDFISNNREVPKSALIKVSPTQYDFVWTPGYEFVKDPLDSLRFELIFYVLDKSQNRRERTVQFVIKNTINEAEKDQYYYSLYRGALVNAWGLLEQMKEKEEELKRSYRRAKKGKQNRSVLNATLGASTGLAPVIAGPTNPTLQRSITTIGGTSVMTIGTLEATEVIGRSTKDLLDRFNYVMDKKSELQNKGDIFAREFGLKATRRSPDFIRKLDEFRALMSLKGLVALELDANWENKKEANDKAIKRAFKDFTTLEENNQ